MVRKKILILGARGMLGSDLVKVLSEDFDVVAWGHEDLDVTDKDAVKARGSEISPDIIINATGYTNVDGAEEDRESAFALNGDAVKYLNDCDAILVHYSTDYVFDGEKDGEYQEDDVPNPINVYGESKLRGEQTLYGKHYLIRTSWLYGSGGKNFVDTMLGLARDRDEIKVVNDQIGKPTYTLDLAYATAKLLSDTPDFGTYHLVNEGAMSWYDFAKEIFEISGVNVKLTPVLSSEFPRPAKRPKNSALRNTKRPHLRSVKEAIKDYLTKVT